MNHKLYILIRGLHPLRRYKICRKIRFTLSVNLPVYPYLVPSYNNNNTNNKNKNKGKENNKRSN